MKFFKMIMLTAVLLVASSPASAQVCKVVNAVAKAAVAGVITQAGLAAVPVTAVAHSSGALILTGTTGYVANTLGFVAGVWAVATSPVTIPVSTGVLAAGAGAIAVCRYMKPE